MTSAGERFELLLVLLAEVLKAHALFGLGRELRLALLPFVLGHAFELALIHRARVEARARAAGRVLSWGGVLKVSKQEIKQKSVRDKNIRRVKMSR